MRFRGAIFDVDGVLVDSPHEQAWRESLRRLMDGPWHDLVAGTRYGPEGFTTEVYQAHVAGKPRFVGAAAALEYFGVPDPEGARLRAYADAKQAYLLELAGRGEFTAFDDAVRFLLRLKHAGLRIAAASSSKNANMFLAKVPLPDDRPPTTDHRGSATTSAHSAGGRHSSLVDRHSSLLDAFDANLSGRDVSHGKPAPDMFLAAAAELGLSPSDCMVIEDAAAGVQAAVAGGMFAIGVARLGDEALLQAAGADLVVSSLDDVDAGALLGGVGRE